MKIVFYDTKPYDKVWFEIVANDEGFETKYIEETLDINTVVYTKGYDAICILNETIEEITLNILKDNGIKAILLRNENINKSEFLGINEYGMSILRVPMYSPREVA